jgi:hypothetical protein
VTLSEKLPTPDDPDGGLTSLRPQRLSVSAQKPGGHARFHHHHDSLPAKTLVSEEMKR